MSATAEILIHDLAERGVRLTRHADRLRVEATAGTVTPELRLILSARKADLLAALSADSIREHLLALADAELIDAGFVHTLQDADVSDCAGLPDETLRSYVHALRDADLRERGKRPSDETAPALCRSCGPIWVHPSVAAAAPVVGAWAHVLGYPWCHVKNRRAIPRPPVTCGDCLHFIRDAINPDGGMGRCTAEREPLPREPLPFPHAARQCEQFKPEGTL